QATQLADAVSVFRTAAERPATPAHAAGKPVTIQPPTLRQVPTLRRMKPAMVTNAGDWQEF
ncbi:MAG TPA: hypothetical protein DD418_11570, partial [Pseudomonas sp.]|nr:hypothetical protein [Pseudomonas sp.]